MSRATQILSLRAVICAVLSALLFSSLWEGAPGWVPALTLGDTGAIQFTAPGWLFGLLVLAPAARGRGVWLRRAALIVLGALAIQASAAVASAAVDAAGGLIGFAAGGLAGALLVTALAVLVAGVAVGLRRVVWVALVGAGSALALFVSEQLRSGDAWVYIYFAVWQVGVALVLLGQPSEATEKS